MPVFAFITGLSKLDVYDVLVDVILELGCRDPSGSIERVVFAHVDEKGEQIRRGVALVHRAIDLKLILFDVDG